MKASYVIRGNCPTGYVNIAVVPASGNDITFASTIEASEQPFARYGYLMPYRDTVLSGNVDLPRLLGQSISTYRGDDSNESVVGASPSSVPNIQLIIQTFNGTAYTTNLTIHLIYHVEYFMLKQLVSS
jgi:hypothetical protein